MNKFQSIQQFLVQQSYQIPVLEFILNLVLATFFSYLLGKVYIKYGTSLSNRKMFAKNFILITMITMLVISVVKSSLALSLGLVGALSIVRFRAAIKEPEELAYLFFAIALGLGFGANQGIITSIAFIIICVVLKVLKKKQLRDESKNLFLTVTAHKADKVGLQRIVDTLSQHCPNLDVKRFDGKKDLLEVSFLIDFENFEQLNKAQAALLSLDDSMEVTFLDHKDFTV